MSADARLTRTLIVVEDMKHGGLMLMDYGEYWYESPCYCVLSEPLSVTFAPRKRAEVVAEQVAALTKAEHELRDKFASALNDILARKQSLLALDAPTEAPPSFDTCLVTD